ncbi:MAG: winged helix-turn-helix domain-containing protein, partial [Lentisphaerae bacterium]|nr:winged helix-turn-helix domain-containing protein [Lentisphaerota bacterium]
MEKRIALFLVSVMILGLSRETVNRRLADLEKRGLVQTGRSEIRIPDWTALESEATS